MSGFELLKKMTARPKALLFAGVSAYTLLAAMPSRGRMVAKASDEVVPPPALDWQFSKPWNSFDHAGVKRGYQVYRQVCSSCHSLGQVSFRNFVDVIMTEEEAKAHAAEFTYQDGPDETGDMFERPGKLNDRLPSPFRNAEEAKFSNNGAVPPDLSLIIKARVGGPDYVFALLNGYHEPPAGVDIREGQYYNVYFPGGAIGMAPPLSDDIPLEYWDGTQPSQAQMAKDVVQFLSWAAEPEHDDRKRAGLKAFLILSLAVFPTLYWKRKAWQVIKTRQIYHLRD